LTSRELDSAGITGPARAGYLIAADLLERKARARGAPFLVRHLVHVRKRPYLEVLFAFLTTLDDIVDDPTRSVEMRNRRLDRLRAALTAATGESRGTTDPTFGPLMTALVHFMRTWGLPVEEAEEYLRAQRGFMTQRAFATTAELEKEYLDPLAPPAIWANTSFEPSSADSGHLCRTATTAFQLIDVIWDLREDLALGHLYVPLDRLAAHDLDRESVERQLDRGPVSPGLAELLAAETEHAASLLAGALDWPKTIAPAARPFVEWDLAMNRLKLAELRRGAFDDLVRRASPSRSFKLRAATRTLLDVGRAVNGHRRAGT
jgi:15-cis-phytoene synthase